MTTNYRVNIQLSGTDAKLRVLTKTLDQAVDILNRATSLGNKGTIVYIYDGMVVDPETGEILEG